jgi:hypothetical protein
MAVGAMPKKHASYIRSAVIALASFVSMMACGQGNGGAACLGEDVERCTCADGRSGFTVCDPSGSGYGACNCDLDGSPYLPEAGVEASSADGAEEGDGGLNFMDPCSTAAGSPQCPPGDTCYNYPSKGPHCSHPCTVATDCPPPSPGCTPMGECKAP